MYEYQYYNGEYFITFDIVNINNNIGTIAVTDTGKINVIEYDLFTDTKGLYFEYGNLLKRIYLKDFEIVKNK